MKHDCVIGNRCREFFVTTVGMPFNVFVEKGTTFSPQIQTLQGKEENIKRFLEDLKRDKRVTSLEREGNSVFFIERRKEKIPATFYHRKILFVKPVFVDTDGVEHWEIASWEKPILADFILDLQKEFESVKVAKIQQTKLTDITFGHLAPKLSEHQKRAVNLAFENGFYEWPKRTNLHKLAKKMGLSVPTYREHLKRAEEKLMPDLMRSIE